MMIMMATPIPTRKLLLLLLPCMKNSWEECHDECGPEQLFSVGCISNTAFWFCYSPPHRHLSSCPEDHFPHWQVSYQSMSIKSLWCAQHCISVLCLVLVLRALEYLSDGFRILKASAWTLDAPSKFPALSPGTLYATEHLHTRQC